MVAGDDAPAGGEVGILYNMLPPSTVIRGITSSGGGDAFTINFSGITADSTEITLLPGGSIVSKAGSPADSPIIIRINKWNKASDTPMTVIYPNIEVSYHNGSGGKVMGTPVNP